jgi:hypothetical protein
VAPSVTSLLMSGTYFGYDLEESLILWSLFMYVVRVIRLMNFLTHVQFAAFLENGKKRTAKK